MPLRRWLALATGVALLAGPPASASATQPRIPLRPGLTIVCAVSQANGDYETILRVMEVSEQAVTMAIAADVPLAGDDLGTLGGVLSSPSGSGDKAGVREVRGRRTVRREDLREAREFLQYYSEGQPEVVPGTTTWGVSAAVLRDLKTRGQSPLTMSTAATGLGTALSGLLQGAAGELADLPGIQDVGNLGKVSGIVKRVETNATPVPVVINDQPSELPAIHAHGTLGDQEVDLYLLDDPENPLALRLAFGEESLRVVKISFPEARDPQSAIARRLTEAGKADLYGIYFDFASASLKEESETVLAEIAAAMKEHPDWKLTVEGHTDAIGEEGANLELSVRRAAAVKEALVARYGIAAERLATAGFGESRPKRPNDTVEGRALNRRVQLTRR